MKKILPIYLLFMICSLYSQDQETYYPDGFFFIYKLNGNVLLLGGEFEILEEKFGQPISDQLIFEHQSPVYQYRKAIYDEFIIIYSTKDYSIDYIEILSDKIITSRGIEIGSKTEDVVFAYGENYVSDQDLLQYIGEDLIYREYVPEINIRGEDTYLEFVITNGTVEKIIFRIESSV